MLLRRPARVPRALRGIRAGSAPGSFDLETGLLGPGVGSLDPDDWPGAPGTLVSRVLGRGRGSAGLLGGATTRRAAWRRARARRVLAAVLAGVATWIVVSAVVPEPVETGVPVVVVTHDLPTGTRVGTGDVRIELRPASQRPGPAVTDLAAAVGRVVAGPVATGELLTTPRFLGAASLAGLSPARVAMSIPLVDDGLVAILRAGDSVTVLAPGTGIGVARSVPVLAVGGVSGSVADGSGGLDGAGGLGSEGQGAGGLGSGAGLGAVSAGGAGARVVLGLTPAEASATAAAMGGASGLTGFVLTLSAP